MTEKDARQFLKMDQQITAYKDSKITLKTLIGDLIFLRDALDEVDKNWEYEFTDSVADLESVYSYLIEKELDQPDDLTNGIVSKSLKKIVDLIPQNLS